MFITTVNDLLLEQVTWKNSFNSNDFRNVIPLNSSKLF